MIDRRKTLRKLVSSTALIGSLVGFSGTARAQATPSTPTVVEGINVGFETDTGVSTSASALDPAVAAIDGTANTLQVRLNNNAATILNWDSFNIDTGRSVDFNTLLANAAVLNRVTSIGGAYQSNISGSLTSSGGNVAVWLINPNGIVVGATGAISTGSFVGSTIDVTDADFIDGDGSYALSGPLASTAAIEINGGSIVTNGERGLVLVAPRISANGTFDADPGSGPGVAGDVAFVTASKVLLTYTPGSPLKVALQEGTAVSGASQVVGGTVEGRNIYFALASQDAITDSLLSVSASATAAATSTRGVLLFAGRSSSADGDVTIDTAGSTAGTAGIDASGTLNSEAASGAGIRADASGDITLAGTSALQSGGAVDLVSGGAITAAGGVRAVGNYGVSGIGPVVLGASSATTDQRAGGAVSITGQAGVQGLGTLTLQSNADGIGAEDLTLVSGAGGAIDFAATTVLLGGTARQSSLRIGTDSAADQVGLGNIEALALLSAVGGGGYANGITRTTGLRFGNVTLTNSFQANSGGALSLGSVQVTNGAVDLDASGLISASGAISGSGAVTLDGGSINVLGVSSTGGTTALTASGNVTAGNVGGLNGVTVSGGAVSVADASTTNGTLQLSGTSLQATSARSINGDVVLSATAGALSVNDVDAGTSVSLTQAGAGDLRADTVDAGGTVTVDAAGALRSDHLVSTGGAVTVTNAASVGGVVAGTRMAANGNGGVSITTGGAALLAGLQSATGNIQVSAASIDASSAAAVLGSVSLSATSGALSVNDVDAGTTASLTQAGAGDLRADTVDAGGTVTVGAAGALRSDHLVSTGGAVTVTNAASVGGVVAGTRMAANGNGGVGITTGGAALLAGLQSATGNIQVNAASIDASSAAAVLGSVSLSATSGALSVNDVDAGTTASLTQAGAGDLRADTVDAGGTITVGAAGELHSDRLASTADNVVVTGSAAIRGVAPGARMAVAGATGIDLASSGSALLGGLASSAGAIRVSAGTIDAGSASATGNVTLGASSGDLIVAGTIGGGEIRLDSPNAITLGGAVTGSGLVRIAGVAGDVGFTSVTSTGSTVTVTSNGNVSGGAAAGFAGLQLHGASIGLTGAAVSANGGVEIIAATGDISVPVITARGLIELTAGRDLLADTVSSSAGAISVLSAHDVRGVLAASRGAYDGDGGVTINASGAALLGNLVSGHGAIGLTAASIDMLRGSAQGSLALTSTGGNIASTGFDPTGGAITILANGGTASVLGDVTGSGSYSVTGTSVTLGGVQRANGAVDIVATSGGITNSGALSLTSNADAAGGGDLTLRTTGGVIDLGAGTRLFGGTGRESDVILDTAAGNAVTLGGVDANRLTIAGGVRLGAILTGNIDTNQAIALLGNAAIRTSTLTARGGGVAIDSSGGGVTVGAVSAPGAVGLTGTQIDFTTIDGGATTLLATGGAGSQGVRGTRITAAGDVSVTGTALGMGGRIDIGLVETAAGSGGTVQLTTSGGAADIVSGQVRGDGAVTIVSSGDVRIPAVESLGNVRIDALAGEITGAAPTSAMDARAGVAHTLEVHAGTLARLGTVSANAVSVTGDTVFAGIVDGGSGLTSLIADNGELAVTGTVDGGAVTLRASGAVRLDGGVAATAGAVQVDGGTGVRFTTITGDSAAITSNGAVRGTGVTAANGIAVTGASIDIGTVDGSSATLNATADGGGLAVTTLTASAGSAALTSNGSILVDSATARDGFTALARGAADPLDSTAGSVRVNGLRVTGGNAALTSERAGVTLGTAEISGNLGLAAALAAVASGDVTAGGTYAVRGGSVVLGGLGGRTQKAGGRIEISSTTGAISGGAGLLLHSDSNGDSANDGILLDAATNIAMAGTTLRARYDGGAFVGLRTGAGGTVALGDIWAGQVGGVNAAHDATPFPYTGSGSVTLGNVRASALGLNLSAGDITAGNLAVSGETRLATAGSGAIRTGNLASGTLTIAAGGALNGGDYLVGGTVEIKAAAITLASLASSNAGVRAEAGTGDLRIGTLAAKTDATLIAKGAAVLTDLRSSDGNVSVDAGTIDVTGADARLKLALKTNAGALRLGTGKAGGDAELGASDMATIGAIESTGGLVSVVARSADIGTALASRSLSLRTTGGNLVLGTGGAGTTASLDASADLTVSVELRSGGAADLKAGGNARLRAVATTGGALSVVATAGEVTGIGSGGRADLSAGGTGSSLTVRAGPLARLGTASAAQNVDVDAAAIDATSATATAGTLKLNASGSTLRLVTGSAGAGAELTARGDLGVEDRLNSASDATLRSIAGSARVANVTTTNGNITVQANAGEVTGFGTGAANLTANGTGRNIVVEALAMARLGMLRAASNVSVRAGTASIAGATATSGALALTATAGDLGVTGDAAASTTATVTATGRASLARLTAGTSVTLTAADAELSGPLQAPAVTIVNAGSGALRLGDLPTGVADGSFQLSSAEVNRIAANTLVFDQGSGADNRAVVFGALAFGADTGRTLIDVRTRGAIGIHAPVSFAGGGAGRTLLLGGTSRGASASGTDNMASEIRVVVTSGAGGRLILGDGALDLRGERIAIGDADFIGALFGTAQGADAVAEDFVSNAYSQLYRAHTAYADQTFLTADRVTVRYGTYALFQNAGLPGSNAGVALGGTAAAPLNSVLTLIGPGVPRSAFAMFGSINGVTGSATAVLGSSVIAATGNTPTDSRLNGCIIGTGAGCLSTLIIAPALNLFDLSRVDVLTVKAFDIPFDPVIGTNNEALYSSLEEAPPEKKCPPGEGPCPDQQETKP